MRKARIGAWYSDFTQRLQRAIDATGLIGVDLAERLGVTEATVSRWRSGHVPEPEMLPRLTQVLGVSLDALFGVDRAYAKHLAEERAEYLSDGYHSPVDNESRDSAPAALKVPIKGAGNVAIPIGEVPKHRRHRLRSMVSARIQKLSGRELMFLRLDGGFDSQLQPHDVLSVKEVRGDGGPHIVVVQVIAAAAAEPAGGSHPQRAGTARGSGRPRNIRRKPELGSAGTFDEDDDDTLSREG